MEDGTVLTADNILSGCSPYTTFIELMGESKDIIQNKPTSNDLNNTSNHSKTCEKSEHSENNELPPEFVHHLEHTDFSCGAFKINCAVDRLPDFTCYPSPIDGRPGPMHMGKNSMNSFISCHSSYLFYYYFY